MKSIRTAWQIRTVFAAIALMLTIALTSNIAHAEESQGSSLSIAPSGQVIAKGATVTAVYGNTLVADVAWGPTRMTFVIQTSGSTRFVPDMESSEALGAIRPGHMVAFTGTLSGSYDRPTVLASVVKDSELVRESVTVLGEVEKINTDTDSFTIRVSDTETTVMATQGTIMTRDGNRAEVSDLEIGDTARVTGSLDVSSGTLTASRISVTRDHEEPIAEAGEQTGMLASLIGWLKGSRGILSVRDR